jgi:phosphonate transport system substrate-binding protein
MARAGELMVAWREPWTERCALGIAVRRTCNARGARLPVLLAMLLVTSLGVLAAPGERAWAAEPRVPTAPGYRFGVFPYLPVLTIDPIFGPIAASFAARLRRPVYLKTRSTFEQFAEQLSKQAYDLLFVHPFFYVQAAERYGYLPLARLEGQLTAVALVRQDRPWRTWSDLAGQVIAMPPALTAVSELTRVALVDAGLIPGIDATLRHYRTKLSCVQAVDVGTADACVLPRFVLPQIEAIGQGKLRIMTETPGINHLLFATHPRVSDVDRRKLLAVILSWPETEQGRAILAVGSWPRFVTAHDADYAQVRDYSARLRVLAHR